MAGRGPTPKGSGSRQRTNAPARGEWKATPGVGWQHGEIPPPPEGLKVETSARVWTTWFRSWFAANWSPDQLPQLELTLQYWDQVQHAIENPFLEADGIKGGTIYYRRPSPMTELRQHMDSLGITFKGQQDRRWEKPVDAEPERSTPDAPDADPREIFGQLRAVK